MKRARGKSERPGRRVLHVAGVALRAFAIFSTALVALALLSLELGPVRRFVVARINDALRPSFEGRVTIERVEHLGLGGIRGARVRVDDAAGTQVLLVDGASVRVSPLSTLRSVLLGKGDMVIDLPEVKLAYVDANLDGDGGGALRLAKAFEPKDKTPSPPPSRKVALRLGRIAMDHAWLHGVPPEAPLVDADLDRLSASAYVGSTQKIDLDGIELTTRALPRQADVHIAVAAGFAAPAESGADRAGHVNIRGDVGGIPLVARAAIDGKAIEATLDVPNVTPDMIAMLAPKVVVTENLSLYAEARGRLPEIEATLHASAGRGALDLRADVVAADEKVLHATLEARRIDAHALSASAASTDLGADAKLDVVAHANGDVEGTYAFDLLAGTVGSTAVPSARLDGYFRGKSREGEPSSMSLTGGAVVDEPGVRTKLEFDARHEGDVSTVGFDVVASVPRLEQTRLGSTLAGSAEFRARGTAVMGAATTVDLDADLRASNLAQGDGRIQRAWLRAHVRGAADDPRIDAIFQGSELAFSNISFATAAVTSRGSLRRSDVTFDLDPRDAPKVAGRGSIETGAATTVRDAYIALSRDDQRAVIGVRYLGMAEGGLRIDGVTVEGLGDPLRAEVRQADGRLSLKASTNEIDLSRLGKLLRSSEIREGHLSFDIDTDVRPSAARGHVRAALVHGQFARARNASGSLDVTIDGHSVDAVLHANVGDVGKIDVSKCHVEVDGDVPLGASSLKRAFGALSFDSELDLARIRSLLPRGSVRLTDLAGRLRLKGEVTRKRGTDAIPDVRLSAETHGLLLSGRGERERVNGARVLGYRPWSLEGVDVQLAATVAELTGATEIEARLRDGKGALTSLDVRSPEVPYGDWMRGRGLSVEKLGALRVASHLVVPRRDLKALPAMLKTQQFTGDVALDLAVDGPLADPDVRFSLETAKVASAVGTGTKPLDAKVTGRFVHGEGKVDAEVSSNGRSVFEGEVTLAARLAEIFAPTTADGLPWRASARVKLAEFPLATSGYFSDLRLKGYASGELTVDDLHEDARAKLALAFRDLAIGRAQFPRGTAHAEVDGRSLRAALRLDQTDGFLETEAAVGVDWGRRAAPKPTTDIPASASLKASALRASAIVPFVSSAASELDGRIDADARIDIKAGGGPPTMQGSVTLRDGMVQLARVGEPLHGVNMKVVVTPDGLVRLDDFTAHGSTGTLSAKAVARLDGFDLVGARANVRIPRRDPLPVDIDGQEMGDVDGDMAISVDRAQGGRLTKVAIDIPSLHARLPLSSSHKTQELGEAKGVRIGYFRKQRQFVLLPMNAEDLEEEHGPSTDSAPSRTEIAIHLGKDVEIKRGTTLKVMLEGDPKLEITDEARMSGQIRLTRGILEVQGKRFEIERGTVSFVGEEPGNPQVLVTAGWTAPDGTRVYADFVGPLKTGTVKLRSEPARPQNEILALVMFGTAEGSSATPYAQQQPSGATRAGTTAGGFATEGLSKGLDELTGLEVSTKIDTTNSANPKPEIEVQIARDISLQLGYVIGTPPPGTNPDRTLITLDWRFRRNWSMEATFGDQGSSIMDFVWRYRY
jgi:translocation and assembly module TamB